MTDPKMSSAGRLLLPRRSLVTAAVLGAAGIVVAASAHEEEPLSGLDLEPVAWARKMPPTPTFPRAIDPYAGYVGQSMCSPTNKPGPVDVKNLIIRTYGNRSWSIARPCQSGVSEHYDGRALDIAFNAFSATSRKNANDFLYWLLRPDQYGNRNAMARRLGIMYAIWNRKMWRAYMPSSGWLNYTGSVPHTDHIHLSFSWNGALRRTSYWTT